MPAHPRGTIYPTKGGYGIRWPENGKKSQQAGFRTRTEAREWFNKKIKPRLGRHGPSADIAFDTFCVEYLERWGVDVSTRTKATVEEWLAPARERFGRWTLAELEGAADDFSRCAPGCRLTTPATRRPARLGRCSPPPADGGTSSATRHSTTGKTTSRAARRYSRCRGPSAAVVAELDDANGALVTFAAETGLRTNEWAALERRDIDKRNPAVAVTRRYAGGVLTPYPKTARRRVPLTPRAFAALPTRIDSSLIFRAPAGGYIDLDNWRLRAWYPALDAAGVAHRGPYNLRHTFATEALAAGVSIFQLARLMGASVKTIELHYGHLAHDSEETLRGLLTNRSDVFRTSAEAE
ncbi:MAG TPA: site-specific integrase [Solirubrobacteraceae bacterium]|jgi:integrase